MNEIAYCKGKFMSLKSLNDLPKRILPTIHNKNIVAHSRLFKVEQMALEFNNGEQRVYERLVSPPIPAVIVVPLLDDNTLVLIQEYAGGRECYEIGLPKGSLDDGETAEQAANRELMEEAGFGAHQLTVLTEFSVVPAYMSHRITVVLAEDLYTKKIEGDEPESITVLTHPLEDIDSLLMRDDFSEARSFAAIYMVRDIIRKRKGLL